MSPRKHLVVSAVVAILALSGADGGLGQMTAGEPRDHQRLATFLDGLTALGERLEAKGNPVSTALRTQIDDLRAEIPHLSAHELAKLDALFDLYPEALAAPSEAAASLSMERQEGNCLAVQENIDVRAARFGVSLLAVGAKGFCEFLACEDGGLDEEVDCLVSLGACPVAAALDLAKLALDVALFADDYCGLRDHQGAFEKFEMGVGNSVRAMRSRFNVLRSRLDAPTSTRASQVDLDQLNARALRSLAELSGVAEAVGDELMARGERERASRILSRRLRIEEHLQHGEGGQIASYHLPEALGGQLERVREVVAHCIRMVEATGEEPQAALRLFDHGDALANRGRYDRAFRAYRQAYRLATRPEGHLTWSGR